MEEVKKQDYEFEEGNVYEGFKLIKSEDIKDIKSRGYVFEHEKTKARLVYIKNKDKNKVFSIGFRTPPTNNTGIPHIIEHSVLCGSKKYPVKEPFVELIKGSVNTFLNAMTMPDMTLYPVASTNEKDFTNLMSVYLDAVFYPNIYNKKEIFMQEGWHYELLNKKDPLQYKGVVYNEMKGVYSSPDSVMFFEAIKSLYPDTIYSKEYGGFPEEIPDLTYQEFLDFHKKFYHPSNSYIYIYGDLNPTDAIKKIGHEYLDDFEYSDIDSKIKMQERFEKPVEVEKKYVVDASSEDISKKTLMSLNYSMESSKDMELNFALGMLENYLLESSASNLKKAIVEKGLATDIYGFYEDDIMQPFMSFNIVEMKRENKIDIINIVNNEFKRLVEEGIDYELMEGIINRTEFSYRKITEGDPLGLHYNYSMFRTWLYDGDALSSLYFEDSINAIRSKYKDGYFEALIDKYFIKNNHKSVVVLVPDLELKEKKENALREKLASIKSRMSDKEINEVIKNTKDLIKAQNKPDDKKALKTIPQITIDDLTREAEKIEIDKENFEGMKVYKSECQTNRIFYLDFTFDTSKVAREDIPYINLLTNLFTEVSTKNMSYDDIAKKIGLAAGDIDFSCEVLGSHLDVDKYNPIVVCHMEMLEAKRDDMIKLASEVINNTKFDEDSKIREVISKLRVSLEQNMTKAGHLTVAKRIQAYYSELGKYGDMIAGFDFYEFICRLDSNFEKEKDKLKETLERIRNIIFKQDNAYITVVCEDQMFDKTKGSIKEFISALPKDKEDGADNTYENYVAEYELKPEALNEGVLTQSDIQYVGLGANFRKLGYQYSGSIHVLKHLLEYDYLWNNVRVKGGAYGSKLICGITGDFIFASYRDPNLDETYDNYKGTVKYLKGLKLKDEFSKYIIGTIGGFDKPLNPYAKAKVAERRDIRGITHEDIQKERDEILGATEKEIKGYVKILKDVISSNMICTLGNERKIKAAKTKFNKLRTLKNKE